MRSFFERITSLSFLQRHTCVTIKNNEKMFWVYALIGKEVHFDTLDKKSFHERINEEVSL